MVQVSRILHSGKLRAKQTAEALSEHLHPTGGSSETDGLAPLDDPTIWAGRLAEELEDLAAFDERADKRNLRFEDVIEDLKCSGQSCK